MAAGILLFNSAHKLLIVKPTYKELWSIPGGVINKNESPREAAMREAREELGLRVTKIKLLAVDYMSPETRGYPTKDENIQFTFYGGKLRAREIRHIRLPKKELFAYRFLEPAKAMPLLSSHLRRRLKPCLKALEQNKTVYLENSVPRS